MKACVVHSVDIDSSDAVAELIAGAYKELGSAVPRAAILFAGIDHDFALVLRSLNEAWPGTQLIGCSTDGEFSSRGGFAEDSLALVLLAGDDFTAVSGVATSVSSESAADIRASVEAAMRRLAPSGGAPRLCITTPLGLNVSTSIVLDALREGLGETVPVFGGTAGDQWRFKDTWQFHGTEAYKDAVPFLLFGDGVHFSFGVETGWRPVGREGRVSDAVGSVVRRIDGKPATAFYREFLGTADITHLTEYPLAITVGDGKDANSYFLRASSVTDEVNGWLHFLGDVPAGSRVHITATSRDQILAATRVAIRRAMDDFRKGSDGGPALAVCFSCAGRKQILGSRTPEEGKIVHEVIGDVPAVGFYGYGEIAPLARDGVSHYHNETFTVLLMGAQ